MPYTDRQEERIRNSVMEYYERHHFGPRKMTWAGLCDEMFDYTEVQVRYEELRQWATGFIQKGRKKSLRPKAEETDSIVKFLMHPKIDMLSPDELEDPDPPRFLHSFVQFLHGGYTTDAPQAALGGVYESWRLAETGDEEEKWIKTKILLEVNRKQIVRATERMEIHFRGNGETDVIGGDQPSEGWGGVAPDGNLFLFMKTRAFVRNYYYVTMAVNLQSRSKTKVHHLVLLRHERPASCDPSVKTWEGLIKETNGRTAVLNFNKVDASNTGAGE
jgi:hypothetical protein